MSASVPSVQQSRDASPSSPSPSSAPSTSPPVDSLLSALAALLSAELQSSSSQYALLTDCNNIAAGKVVAQCRTCGAK